MTKINPCTLVFLIRDDSVLLATKRGGEAVNGTLLGPGGKIEPGETPLDCAIRKTKEELGVNATALRHVGFVTFDNSRNDYESITTGEIYLCTEWQGTPQSSDELEHPKWYPLADLPVDKMSPEKRLWVPQILAGKKVRAIFEYDANKELVDHKVTIIDTL